MWNKSIMSIKSMVGSRVFLAWKKPFCHCYLFVTLWWNRRIDYMHIDTFWQLNGFGTSISNRITIIFSQLFRHPTISAPRVWDMLPGIIHHLKLRQGGPYWQHNSLVSLLTKVKLLYCFEKRAWLIRKILKWLFSLSNLQFIDSRRKNCEELLIHRIFFIW